MNTELGNFATKISRPLRRWTTSATENLNSLIYSRGDQVKMLADHNRLRIEELFSPVVGSTSRLAYSPHLHGSSFPLKHDHLVSNALQMDFQSCPPHRCDSYLPLPLFVFSSDCISPNPLKTTKENHAFNLFSSLFTFWPTSTLPIPALTKATSVCCSV